MKTSRPRTRKRRARPARCSARTVIGVALALTFATSVHASTDLTALSLEQLLEVTVVGASKYEQTLGEVAAAVSVISRDEIKAFGWRTLAEALASLPGVYTTYDRQYTYLGTRGFGLPGDFNTRVLVTINGNRVNDAVFDQAYIGRDFPVDMDLVDRIEFIPGPGGAVYGQNAMFGVVNVVTRSGAQVDGAEMVAAYQRPQGQREGRASWGRRLDDGVDVLLSVSGMRARGQDRFIDFGSAGVSGVAAGLDGERDQEFLAHLARGPWSFDFSYGDRLKNDPVGTYLSDPLTQGQYQRDRHLLAQLQYQDRLADNTLHLSTRLFLGGERYDAPFSYAGVPTAQTAASDWRGAEIRLVSTAWASHKLMLGTEYQVNARQDQAFDDFATAANSVAIPGSGWRAGLYAQDEWSVGDTLSATLGLRLDGNNAVGNALSPRVGLIWRATPQTVWKALYGRAHRAPNVFERDFSYQSQVANPSLDGEMIDTVELVADHRVGPELALRGSVYYWTMEKLITLATDPVSGLPQYQNGKDVRAVGVELSGARTWGWGGHLRGSLSYQHPRYGGGDKLPNSPQLLGKLSLSAPLAATDLRLGYELQYSSQRMAIDGTGVGGYALHNVNLVADRWAKGLEVSLGIFNVLDTHYQQPASRNNWQNVLDQDGRSVRATLLYKF
jgi:iron complex outermembrane receptor protein